MHAPRRRLPRILTLSLAALAMGAAPAAAATATYDVVYEGTGTYAHQQKYTGANGGSTAVTSTADWSWNVRYPGVTFVDGRLREPVDGAGGVDVQSRLFYVITTPFGGSVTECRGDRLAPDPGPARLEEYGGVLDVRPVGVLRPQMTCSGGALPSPWALELSSRGEHVARFTLPREATTMGKIIQQVAGAPGLCPDRTPLTTLCTFSFSGTLTFVRRDEVAPPPAASAPEPAPAPTPAPAPAPALAPGGPGTGTAAPVPAPAVRARLAAGGRSAAVTVACAAACRGTVRAYAGARGPLGRPLAAASYAARAGRTASVRVAFGAAARRAIRRAGAVRLVVGRSAGGAPVTRVLRAGR